MANSYLDHDIIIAGGGIPGLTLALLLGRAGCRVAVIEAGDLEAKAGQADTSGRTAALIPENITLLEHIGAWATINPHAAPMRTLRIVDDCDMACSPIIRDFRAADIGLDNLGHNVPLHATQIALYGQAKDVANITLLDNTKLYDFVHDDTGITIRTDNGTQMTASLLIGADGRNSLVRALAGIETQTHDYGQSALTAIVAHECDHAGISIEFHRPGGPFTLVPMPGRQSALVWVVNNDEAANIASMDATAQNAAIQARGRDMLGDIQLATTLTQWPLCFRRAEALAAPRVALMAEAAHVLPPTGAQGLNLSLRDAAGLADTVIQAMRLGLDPGDFGNLRAYERARRRDIALRSLASDSLNRLVRTSNPFIQLLRRSGLSLSNYASPVKNLLMQQGLAPTHNELDRDSA